ncbi:hypothetical protein [Stenotrophomonas sp. 278]|uniref:hypothetical protein n=1 Tax=Stenotrophomonas sp. 278 TaxID=2479851 RepID=UPI000F6772BE|nr:hypothetical protein [Stenotrophomonas sp. 278]RRU17853.1 hypothetical protein EGJ34_06875 [Stenotrophomonas sp. 278]
MAAVIYDFRQFQTVRENVQKAGLSPAPLFAKLRAAQRAGDRGAAVVAEAQRLRRMFRDELDPKGAA